MNHPEHTADTRGRRASGRPATPLTGVACLLVAVVWLGVSLPLAAAQPPADAAHQEAVAGEAEHGEAAHGESTWAFIARLANFAIFAGGLYYLLRKPIGRYLDARSQQIRSDLVKAAETREQAAARLKDIEARLQELPGELEQLKARGREEIAAEEKRIRQAAQAERARLVEQTRREVARELQLARRELTAYAADLAVDMARGKLSQELTDTEQQRLIARYASQVGTTHE